MVVLKVRHNCLFVFQEHSNDSLWLAQTGLQLVVAEVARLEKRQGCNWLWQRWRVFRKDRVVTGCGRDGEA